MSTAVKPAVPADFAKDAINYLFKTEHPRKHITVRRSLYDVVTEPSGYEPGVAVDAASEASLTILSRKGSTLEFTWAPGVTDILFSAMINQFIRRGWRLDNLTVQEAKLSREA